MSTNTQTLTELQDFYNEYKKKLAAYSFALKGMAFDQHTIAPKAGLAYGNQMQGILTGEAFTYSTDPMHIEKIEALYAQTTDELEKKELKLRLRELHQISKLPKEIYVDFQKATSESQQCWEKAKGENDFASFKPHLLSLIEKRKNMLTYFDYEGSDYDYLLDQYEMGMTADKYATFFQAVKEKLVPLIQQIKDSGYTIDDAPLYQTFPLEGQKAFTSTLKEALSLDMEKCYIAESVHPFCMSFSQKDIRLTTKYLPENVMSAILSTAHEYGHALYGSQIKPEFENTMFSDGLGFAVHESQSRFIENHIGRSEAFWENLYPKLQAQFPDQLDSIALTDFVAMLNVSKPGFIRIEADELTYPLHILIRFELEKAIFDGTADIDKLDVLWADKYEEYLGIRPETYSQGVMQDVHWSCAYFGYFPSYALGSAFSAQFYAALEKDMDVEATLKAGEFSKIADWLKEHIHQHGASKTYEELLLDVTGEGFNPNYYTDYLVDKYTKLYKLD